MTAPGAWSPGKVDVDDSGRQLGPFGVQQQQHLRPTPNSAYSDVSPAAVRYGVAAAPYEQHTVQFHCRPPLIDRYHGFCSFQYDLWHILSFWYWQRVP